MFCQKCGKEIPDQAVLCVHCGTTVEGVKAVPAKPKSSKAKNGCLGCLGLIVIFMVIGYIGKSISEKPTIEGDVAKITVTRSTNGWLSAEAAGHDMAELIYNTAKDNPNIKRIEITLYIDKTGISDKYGNEFKENLLMGTLVEDNLEEVRKYKDELSFVYDRETDKKEFGGGIYTIQIERMNYAYLLNK